MPVLQRIDGAALFVFAVSLLIAGVLLVGARSIAPPLFDPVGSAALPRACAVALIAIGSGTLLQSALRPGGAAAAAPLPFRTATLATMVLMALYLLAMQLGLGFVLPTIAFVAVSVPLVSASARSIPLGIGLALLLGVGASWLFSEVFFVDLPAVR